MRLKNKGPACSAEPLLLFRLVLLFAHGREAVEDCVSHTVIVGEVGIIVLDTGIDDAVHQCLIGDDFFAGHSILMVDFRLHGFHAEDAVCQLVPVHFPGHLAGDENGQRCGDGQRLVLERQTDARLTGQQVAVDTVHEVVPVGVIALSGGVHLQDGSCIGLLEECKGVKAVLKDAAGSDGHVVLKINGLLGVQMNIQCVIHGLVLQNAGDKEVDGLFLFVDTDDVVSKCTERAVRELIAKIVGQVACGFDVFFRQ